MTHPNKLACVRGRRLEEVSKLVVRQSQRDGSPFPYPPCSGGGKWVATDTPRPSRLDTAVTRDVLYPKGMVVGTSIQLHPFPLSGIFHLAWRFADRLANLCANDPPFHIPVCLSLAHCMSTARPRRSTGGEQVMGMEANGSN